MIINNSYFKGDIYIAHAKPGITDSVTGVTLDINSFIDSYENEALMKCLGYSLSREFIAVLNSEKSNGLIVGADSKWDDLLNGKEYTDPNGVLVKWEGIRRKTTTSTKYDKSFLADYVFFFYEQNEEIVRGGTGFGKPKAKNMRMTTSTPKVVKAWNRFVELVQGTDQKPNVVQKYGIPIGIDWYGGGQQITLYKFINDMNSIAPDTYAKFNPKSWKTMNQFGI